MVSGFFSRKRSERSHPSEIADDPLVGSRPPAPEADSEAGDTVQEEAPDSNDRTATESAEEAPQVDPATILDGASAKWRSMSAERLGQDGQRFRELRVNLDDAHPGGLAQLYVDHPTRLDTLIREESAYEEAAREIQELCALADTLEQRYGQAEIHLAIGVASWEGSGIEDVPVLMRRARIAHDSSGEVTIQLQPGVEVSTRLLRAIANAGSPVDTVELGRAMRGPDGFVPRSALTIVRNTGMALPGFELKDSLVLGIFTHPAGQLYRELAPSIGPDAEPVVRAYAGDPQARELFSIPPVKPNPFDRDPWKELGVGDQDPQTQDVIEAVAEGHSAVLPARSPGQAPRLTASVAAALVEVGRKVLIVLNREDEHDQLIRALKESGVGPIVADLTPLGDQKLVEGRLIDLLAVPGPPPENAQIASMRRNLTAAREALGAYTELLHTELSPWGVSPYDALQVLTDLTSLADPPKTRVRLPLSSLVSLASDGGESGGELLERASNLGLFNPDSSYGAWQGVAIENSEDVGPIIGSIGRLVDDLLPALRMQMSTTAAQFSLAPSVTLSQWESQLDVLARVRDCLDVFRPDVLERSPANMVVATAPKQWRKDRSIRLKGSELRSLQHQARDSVRTGVHVEDLHAALIDAQEVRQQWKQISSDPDSVPTVPNQLQDLLDTYRAVQDELAVIRPVLEPVYGAFDSLSIDELSGVLEALYRDPEGAAQIPELLQVLDKLDSLGLRDLVVDLRERGIDGSALSLELDLAWWASALGFMLAEEPRLGGFDPEGLEALLGTARDLDQDQVASLGPALVDHALSRAFEAQELYPDQKRGLRAGLWNHTDVESLFATVNLASDLQPIVVAGPAQVPNLIKRGRRIDSIILLDLEGLTEGEVVPLLARGDQVIAIQDPVRALNSQLLTTISGALPTLEVPGEQIPVGNMVSEVIGRHMGSDSLVAVPSPRAAEPFTFLYVDGRGMPAPGVHAIETSSTEVEAVADLIEEQLRVHPEERPTVVVFSDRHAARIATELRSRSKTNTALAKYRSGDEDFRNIIVFPVELASRESDRTIVSVGFAKTPHGRVIHDFGILSTADGLRTMEDLSLGLRGDVKLVSSIQADELDRTRLKKDGEIILFNLLHAAEFGTADQPEVEGDEPESPPELLTDLAERLHRVGLRVVPNYGSDGGMRIPMAIGHPEVPDELLVAVLTDDDAYIGEPSLRVRGRHWPRMLEAQGWKVYTALSMAVFIDPNRIADEIVQLTLDAVDEYYARIGEPQTPAAAAALGVVLPGMETLGATTDEANSGADAVDDLVSELEVTGALQVIQPELLGGDFGKHGSRGPGAQSFSAVAETRLRGPRPPYASGLPLAAYSDEQLDEMAAWIIDDGTLRTDEQLMEALREELDITRHGAQTDAVLRNVARRALDQK
ncbi:prevent-host-death family protein [Actinomycetaceae bacterium MB13-C1-2]|nr:prevent-host-death family protein [Actinomycetaceae bacterium MB13-C1-2]